MAQAYFQVQQGTLGSTLVVVVLPLGVLYGEGGLLNCGIGGSLLIFTGLLHPSCEKLILSYFRGLLSICSRGTLL